MSLFKSTLFSVFVVLAGFLCLLQSSQAICIIEISVTSGDLTQTLDDCSFSFPNCSNITSQTLETTYGLSGFTVTPVLPSRVTISGGETFLVKTALAQYLLACYNYKADATTIYGR